MNPSVVVHDLDVRWPDISPYKADTPLVIDADTVLTLPIIFQGLQVISRRRLQESQRLCGVKLCELSLGDVRQRFEPTRTLALVQRQGVLALERLDHASSLLRTT